MIDFFHEISQTLGHNKLRTALTGIAVTWGIFMLIVLLGMANEVTEGFNTNVMSNNSTQLKIWAGITSVPFHGNREGRRVWLKDADMKELPEKNRQYVEGVTSVISGGGTLSTPKAQVNQSYSGVYPSEFTNRDRGTLTGGRFINDRDLQEKAKVIVIPEYYATQLFPPDGNALGKRVNYAGLSFLVIGVYESKWNRDAYIPFTTARMMSSNREDLGTMTVKLKNVKTEEDGTDAENLVRNTLATAHDFDPKDENALYINNSFTNALKSQSALVILDTSVWVLGLLTLLTGIVGISNIMFVTVKERTHEIGIRRAIGAKPRQILSQVIAESVCITTLFGYIGIISGSIVLEIIAKIFGEEVGNPSVDLPIAIEVTIVLIVAGAFAGLFPALKALKIKPVEALMEE